MMVDSKAGGRRWGVRDSPIASIGISQAVEGLVKMPGLRSAFLSALAVGCLSAPCALATVSLNFNGVSSVIANPGDTFTLRVNLVSTSEQTTGLDYYLRVLSGSNFFSIQDRDISTSPYSDPNQSDATVEAMPDSVLVLKGD